MSYGLDPGADDDSSGGSTKTKDLTSSVSSSTTNLVGSENSFSSGQSRHFGKDDDGKAENDDYDDDEGWSGKRSDTFFVLEKTLRHATLSIFVTSFTTSAAFLSTTSSSLPALKVCHWGFFVCFCESRKR